MDREMMGYCGTYCGICAWRESTGCEGCRAGAGNAFWGGCDKAGCCIGRELEHCGFCPDLPCGKLLHLFHDEEHGDGGTRLGNLENWKNGRYVYEALSNLSQKQARKAT